MKSTETLINFLLAQADALRLRVDTIDLGSLDPEAADPAAGNIKSPAVVAISIGLHPVIVAELSGDLELAEKEWAAAQRIAAITRTGIFAGSGEDLVLIMVAQPGSNEEVNWQSFATEVERNDLVCRKLVWLPPGGNDEVAGSLTEFLRRTFLAKPWAGPERIPQTALDALTLKTEVLKDWEEILEQQPSDRAEVDYDSLIQSLIAANRL